MIVRLLILLVALATPCAGANFTPTTYGAVGDCVTDDTTALFAMRTAILAAQGAGSEAMTISLRGKCYKYTNNRWLWGIRRLYLLGGGARLQNITSFASFGGNAAIPLTINRSAFETTDITPLGSFGQISSADTFFINTATAGATSVTLKTLGDASHFSVGAWVIIFSYDQLLSVFGGYPPDARYTDYAQVTSINGAVINLSIPLAHGHSDSFPEHENSYVGRARIFPLDSVSPIPWGTYAYIENVISLDNPNALRVTDLGYWDPNFKFHNYFLVQGYNQIDLYNVTGATLVPSTASIFNFTNSHFFAAGADKLINTITYKDVVVDNEFPECTAADTLTFTRGSIGLDSGWMFSSPVTISNASPGVVAWTGLLPTASSSISFSTTGALPTGLTPGTVYYIVGAGLTTGAFSVSATPGGAAINTSSAGSGVHTATYSGRNSAVVCSPRVLTFDSTILGSTYISENFPPTWNLNNGGFPVTGSATNTIFQGGGGNSFPVGSSPTLTLTVDGAAVTTSGTAITMADVAVSANGNFLSCTAPAGQIGRVPSGGGAEVLGTITSITGTYAGPNTATIATSGLPTIGIGDTMQCHPTPVGGITLSGNTYLNYGGAPAPP